MGISMKKMKNIIQALAVIMCARVFLCAGGEKVIPMPDFIKGRSEVKAAEAGPESFHPVITWDDYQNTQKLEPTVIHFLLGGGSEVDVELSFYPSVVKQLEYRDINGDGLEEVLIYRYFANSATEYTLIDIFEIKDKSVRNLSPETELKELEGNVWNMSLMETAAEETQNGGSGLVFRLDSYDKKRAITFRDETVLAEYRDDGWKITGHASWKLEQAAGLVMEYMK